MGRLLLVLLVLLTAAPAWGGSEQALRQVAFARAELADGDFERALRSAESALRLDPSAHEATLVKALAYEGLGEFELAQALLLGYLEEVPSVEQDPEAQATLDRVTERLTRRRVRGPRPPTTRRDTGPIDLEPYRRRITTALEEGRPQAAWSAAQELVRAAPDSKEGWRWAGNAANSAGRELDAVRAYRRYQQLGGDDPRVAQMIDLLSVEFGTLEINLLGRLSGLRPQVSLRIDGDVLQSRADGARHVFHDLPPGETATVQVQGQGLAATSQELRVPAGGERQLVELPIESIGLGTLALGAWAEQELQVELHDEGAWQGVKPNERRDVTAGPSVVRISGQYGHVDVEVEVPEGGSIALDPVLYAPAQLTVTGLPAGAEIRVFVEGPEGLIIEQLRATPPRGAAIDAASGIPIAAPQGFRSLAGGRVGVFITHQKWGEGAVEVAIIGGAATSAAFEPATLPNQPTEAVAEAEPKARSRSERKPVSKKEQTAIARTPASATAKKTVPPPPPALAVSAVFGGIALGALGAMGGMTDTAARKRTLAEEHVGTNGFEDVVPLTTLRAEVEKARRDAHGAGVVAATAGILSGLSAGIVLSIEFGRRR